MAIPRRLALVPEWPGFVINSLLYAAAIAALLQVLVAIRCCARRRIGRCVGCGYPREGLLDAVCPECGFRDLKAIAGARTGNRNDAN